MIGTLKPKNGGSFPIAEAEDILMPDGTRLSDFNGGNYPIAEGIPELQPDVYYTFGEVSELEVELVPVDDGKLHEYCFEFVPTSGFGSLTISPEVSWACEPQYPAGKTCQVSIVRGVAVMACA